jgi:hypothetical protein
MPSWSRRARLAVVRINVKVNMSAAAAMTTIVIIIEV